MPDTDANTTSAPSSHLGFRIAVGAVGLVLLSLFIMLGSVAMKQSATQKSLETREANQESAPSAPVRE